MLGVVAVGEGGGRERRRQESEGERRYCAHYNKER